MRPLDLAHIRLDGLHLIEASAGTGKTWTIAALYILLLLERELSPDRILVVTYTKAATAELKERIRRRIVSTLDLYSTGRPAADDLLEQMLITGRPQDRERARLILTRALYAFDDAAIFTIHGFCQRALTENCFESGSLFSSEMIADQEQLLQQVADDFWRRRIIGGSETFVRLLGAERMTPEKLAAPFRGRFQTPGLRIIPPGCDYDLEPLAEPLGELFQRLADSWRSERHAVLETLEKGRLNQRSYSPGQIAAAAASLEQWLAQGNSLAACTRLEFFTPAQLAKALTKASPAPPEHPFFDLCRVFLDQQELLQRAYRHTLTARRQELKQWFEAELSARKQAQNKRCFDDLLLDLHLALEDKQGQSLLARLRERFPAILIDEFQDTDPLQWQIFSRIGGSGEAVCPLFLIGDPKQAIYSFRGADIFAYLQAGSTVDQDRCLTLSDNFRSTPPLVTALNSLFSASSRPFVYEQIGFSPVAARRDPLDALLINGLPQQKPLQFLVHTRETGNKADSKGNASAALVEAMAAAIAGMLAAGRCRIRKNGEESELRPGDIAVLVRSHRQAEHVRQALSVLGIPSVQHGSATIYKSSEAMDLLRILRAAAEPARERLLREALLTPTMQVSANTIAACLESDGELREWESWLARFHTLHNTLCTGGIMAFLAFLLGECGVRHHLLRTVGGERMLTNLQHCCELLHQDELSREQTPHAYISRLEHHICGQTRDDNALLRLESDENAVTIATIHTSKGLQYPLVFVPFAWDMPSGNNDLPVYHGPDGALTIDLEGADDNGRDLARREQAAEQARLLYVALTRAELFCQVGWGCISGAHESPLFRLLYDGRELDRKGFAALSDQELCNDILAVSPMIDARLADTVPAPPSCRYSRQEAPRSLAARRLMRSIPDDWRVASFSSMVAGNERSFQPRDHDGLGAPGSGSVTSQQEPADQADIFRFPRGAEAGSCLHEIFEQLDFAAPLAGQLEQLCLQCLTEFGIEQSWQPTVSRMVQAVCSTPFIAGDDGFTLAHLKPASWQCEMEFYLPLALTTPESLAALFDGLIDPGRHGSFDQVMAGLAFRPTRGMLQGFIDMVFEYGGRYYIVDWKSNHLGNRVEDYGQDKLIEAMNSHAYILQYHLYTIALDSLLRLRLPGYDYRKHFGGAIYVFLRGVAPQLPHYGIFRDTPPEEFIQRARRLLVSREASQVADACY